MIGVTRFPPEDAARRRSRSTGGPSRPAAPTTGSAATPIPSASAFAITCCDRDDTRARAIATAAARWYYGQNDAELNRLRFGSASGIQGVLAAVRDRLDEELASDTDVIGGDPESCAAAIERWAAIGLDQLVFTVDAGRTTHA